MIMANFLPWLTCTNNSDMQTSCDQNKFEKTVPVYEIALKKHGFNGHLHEVQHSDSKNENNSRKRKRKRDIILFNIPYSANVKINVGKVSSRF